MAIRKGNLLDSIHPLHHGNNNHNKIWIQCNELYYTSIFCAVRTSTTKKLFVTRCITQLFPVLLKAILYFQCTGVLENVRQDFEITDGGTTALCLWIKADQLPVSFPCDISENRLMAMSFRPKGADLNMFHHTGRICFVSQIKQLGHQAQSLFKITGWKQKFHGLMEIINR